MANSGDTLHQYSTLNGSVDIYDSDGNDTLQYSAFGELEGFFIFRDGNNLGMYTRAGIVTIHNQFVGTNNVETLSFLGASYLGYSLGTYNLELDAWGSDGNDVLVADSAVHSQLDGGGGGDLLFDGVGNDTLYGDAGSDLLVFGGGNDTVEGGTGNDTYAALVLPGTDTINDESGNDTIAITGSAFQSLNFFKNILTDDLEITGAYPSTSPYQLIVKNHYQGTGHDVESLRFYNSSYAGYVLDGINFNLSTNNTGGSGNDIIAGSNGESTLTGDGGNDLLFGNGGNDTITGGAGNDLISGGSGTDTAVYSGSSSDYSVVWDSVLQKYTVTDNRGGPNDGVDTVLADVERLQFLGGGPDMIICFMAGTMIRTPAGEVAVEKLARGDLVITSDGRAVPVRWLGRQTVSTVFADPLRVLPIRVRAGALGDNVPARDLLVSPDHALFVGGLLVQAGALVNGTSITRERAVPQTFVYYHVEVDDHSLIFAENVPAETFIDNVERLAFDNWDEHEALYPEGKAMVEMPYPRAKAYRQVPRALRDELARRGAGGAAAAA